MPPIGLFSALADETRCTIITMLRQSPLPVHQLAEAFDISRPAISRHLRVLGEAGLVRERKKGRENIYELKPKAMEAGRDWIAGFLPTAVEVQAAAAEPVIAPTQPVAAKAAKPAKPKVERPKADAPAKAPKPKPAPAPVEQMQMAFDL